MRVKAELEFDNITVMWLADNVEPPSEGVAIRGNSPLRALYINGKRVGVVAGFRQEYEHIYADDALPYSGMPTRFIADAILEFE